MLQASLALLAAAAGALASPVTLLPRDGCTTSWNGTSITGTLDGSACRYTVRYGQAERWEYSTAATNQSGVTASDFPSMCPQPVDDELTPALASPSAQSEDCLNLVIYTPPGNATDLPVFVWFHGGSYVGGSESDKGLNGSALATASNIIVVFTQYRLGVLGFLPPTVAPTSGDPNLGTRDAVLALTAVRDNIGAVGGNSSRVTTAGQSAGASLMRSLWAVPSAKGLFHGMILHSDPMNFGTQSAESQAGLQTMIYNGTQLSNCTTLDCLKSAPVATLLAAQSYAESKAPNNVTGVPIGESFRPQYNTETLPVDPINSLFNNKSSLEIDVASVPIMLTSNRNESGYIIEDYFPAVTAGNEVLYNYSVKTFFGADRAAAALSSGLYPSLNGTDGLRQSVEIIVTDAAWRCISREVARRWAGAGGTIYIGEWESGINYTFDNGTYCKTAGVVCHGDDVYPTFDSAPANLQNPTLQDEVHTYWTNFITTGNPGNDAQPWAAFTANGTDADVHGIGNLTVPTCPANFWGEVVHWDWQLWSSNATGPITSASSAVASPTGSKSAATPVNSVVPLGGIVAAIVAVAFGAMMV